MKLNFKILWFDDMPKGLDGAKDRIGNYLRRKGFKP